jgi:hypothetical protein
MEKTLAFGKNMNHDSLFTLESQISHVTFAAYLIASQTFVTHF